MNSQDLSNLQEAYLEVYQLDEGKVPWNDPKNPNPSGYTPAEKNRAKINQLGVNNPDSSSFGNGGPGENEYARHGNLSAAQEKMSKRGNQPKGKPHQFKKNPYWKKTQGQIKRTMFGTDVPKDKKSSYPSSVPTVKEDLDLYDIILSHLLDEGYADTQEAAEVIMVNMSEEWRDDILEESYISEMRKEDKVAGKKKTPLYIPGKRRSMLRAEPGSGKKWQMSEPEKVKNPEASFGRFKQGKDLAGKVMGYGPHPHGEGGRLRGVKQTKGDKSRVANDPGADVKVHLTPKQKVERNRPSTDRGSYMSRYF